LAQATRVTYALHANVGEPLLRRLVRRDRVPGTL
jgi:hypothetical protein